MSLFAFTVFYSCSQIYVFLDVLWYVGVCCDSPNGSLWSFGHGKVHQWVDSGYPCLNLVKQQLAIQVPATGEQLEHGNYNYNKKHF